MSIERDARRERSAEAAARFRVFNVFGRRFID
jgi:hypothetical protein